MKADKSELIIYQTDDGRTLIETRLENETVWLTQPMMAARALARAAQQILWQELRLVAEPGGAAALAALRSGITRVILPKANTLFC